MTSWRARRSKKTISLQYPHKDVAFDDFRAGQVFWAALKNPYHQNVNNRLYLVVSTAHEKINGALKVTAIAVVSLESNGGLGKSCYGPNEQQYRMGIKLHHNTQVGNLNRSGMASEQTRDEQDRSNLYVDDWSTPDWTPLPDTIADMTTVLVIQGELVLCRNSGQLSVQSHGKPLDLYRNLNHATRARVMTMRTPRIPVQGVDMSVRKTSTHYRRDVNPQPTMYDPSDVRFF
ncbi:hypothetical protein E6O75_ATG09958 [Venturia nashicola]|uniref:Uncharacterized protein n=1 Tax=Venturia nashicola TaxID=86259 RepID=A0A4Z1NQ39_9PEZI|nr:hypothetical protein E6O75_ATG09958 [Venturia nashicola]